MTTSIGRGLGLALAICAVILGPMSAAALEVGDRAPDFKLPGTGGTDISLSDFSGKKIVFLEFYGADFQPT
jgi:peroxiredoxin Q/BCP